MSAIAYASIAISTATIAVNAPILYRNSKPLHLARQKYRLEYDGWTLPWWMCWAYWVGLEDWVPKRLRRSLESLNPGEAETP